MPKRKILLCLDLETGSETLARFVADFFQLDESVLHILYVEPNQSIPARLERAQQQLQNLVAKSMPDLVHGVLAVRTGLPEDAILAYAEEHSVDLLVLGHRQDSIERIHVGSTTRAVLSLSSSPVLVVPINHFAIG